MSRRNRRPPARHAAAAADVLERPDLGAPSSAITAHNPGGTVPNPPEPLLTDEALEDEYESVEKARKRARDAGMEAAGLESQAQRRTDLAANLRSQAEGLKTKADTEARAAESELRQAAGLRAKEQAEQAIADHRAAKLNEAVKRSNSVHPAKRRAASANAPQNPLEAPLNGQARPEHNGTSRNGPAQAETRRDTPVAGRVAADLRFPPPIADGPAS